MVQWSGDDSAGSSKGRFTHQVFINFTGALPSFVDGPDDKGLTTTTVTSGEDLCLGGVVLLLGGEDVGARVQIQAKLLDYRLKIENN